MISKTQEIFPLSKNPRKNLRIKFENKTDRNKYLEEKSSIPIEAEQLISVIPKGDYIKLLIALQEYHGSLTLNSGTTLYIENDKSILLLKVIHKTKSKQDISIYQESPDMEFRFWKQQQKKEEEK